MVSEYDKYASEGVREIKGIYQFGTIIRTEMPSSIFRLGFQENIETIAD